MAFAQPLPANITQNGKHSSKTHFSSRRLLTINEPQWYRSFFSVIPAIAATLHTTMETAQVAACSGATTSVHARRWAAVFVRTVTLETNSAPLVRMRMHIHMSPTCRGTAAILLDSWSTNTTMAEAQTHRIPPTLRQLPARSQSVSRIDIQS